MYVSKDVVIRLKNHEEAAFNIFYDNYNKLLFFIIVSLVKNEEVAKDLLQDTFVKIFHHIDTLSSINAFHSYVCLVAKNTALDYLKKTSKFVDMDVDTILATCSEEPNEFMDFSFTEYLNSKEQLIITYNIIYDFTFKEIASMLHMKLSQVYTIFIEAKKKMKDFYSKEGHL